MNYDFKTIMSKMSHDEIIKVLACGSDEYNKEALKYANEEFIKRKLPVEELEYMKVEYAKKKILEHNISQSHNTIVGAFLWVKIGTLLLIILAGILAAIL